ADPAGLPVGLAVEAVGLERRGGGLGRGRPGPGEEHRAGEGGSKQQRSAEAPHGDHLPGAKVQGPSRGRAYFLPPFARLPHGSHVLTRRRGLSRSIPPPGACATTPRGTSGTPGTSGRGSDSRSESPTNRAGSEDVGGAELRDFQVREVQGAQLL